jgi:hypothetical protein
MMQQTTHDLRTAHLHHAMMVFAAYVQHLLLFWAAASS